MPNYPGALNAITPAASNLSPVSPNPGDSVYLFGKLLAAATQLPVNETNSDFEAVTVGTPSIAACISNRKEAGSAPAVSLELIANGNPGAANFQLQEASTDADACYLTPSAAAYTITSFTQKGSNWVAFVDDIPTGGKFMRVLPSANPNGVSWKAKLTLLA